VVRDYELMYIVRPDLDEEALRTATDSVETLVKGLGGEVLKTTMWGKRRLAYEVSHHRDGHYVIVQLQLDTTKIGELERVLEIHDTVFRHLLVRRDETADIEPGEADGEAGPLEGEPPARPARPARVVEALDDVPAAEDEDEPEADAEDEPEADAEDEPEAEAEDEPEAEAEDEPEAEAEDEPEAEDDEVPPAVADEDKE
jgi:small subunit ribosomal protein S6